MSRSICCLIFLASSISHTAQDHSKFEISGLQGLKNSKGKIVIPARFERLGWSGNSSVDVISQCIGFKQNEFWGLVNTDNKRVLPAEYVQIKHFTGNLFIVAKRLPGSLIPKYGIVDSDGKFKQNCTADSYKIHGNNIIVSVKAETNFLFGLIAQSGALVSPIKSTAFKALKEKRYARKNKNGGWQLLDEAGVLKSSLTFDAIGEFRRGKAIASKDQLKGVIDTNGNEIIPFRYKGLLYKANGKYKGLKNGSFLLLNGENEKIRELNFEQVKLLDDGLFHGIAGYESTVLDRFGSKVLVVENQEVHAAQNQYFITKTDSLYGLRDLDHSLVEDSFAEAQFWNQMVVLRNPKNCQLFDLSRQISLDSDLSQIVEISDELIAVNKKGKWGVWNSMGKVVWPFLFKKAPVFKFGVAIAELPNGQMGLIDERGNWIHKAQSKEIEYGNGIFHVLRDTDGAQLLELNGRITYTTFGDLVPFGNSFLEKRKDGKVGLISQHGVKILDPWYDKIDSVGQAFYFQNDKVQGVVTENGKKLSTLNGFEEVAHFSEDKFAIKKKKKWGFVDANGLLLVANRYDSLMTFSEGLAPFKLLGKWGFMTENEAILIQPTFEEVQGFKDQLCFVMRNKKWGILDFSGSLVLDTQMDKLQYLENGRILCKKDGKEGLVSKEGRLLIFPKYDRLTDLSNGYVLVERGGKKGLVNLRGVNTIAMYYDRLEHEKSLNLYLANNPGEWEEIIVK